jgi:ribonuclease HI
VTSLLYYHLFDSGYYHLPASTLCNVPWHDGQGRPTTSHPYLVHGSLLLLQPPGTRRLLQHFEQHVSDTCMIKHLRSIKSKTISSDGGISLIGQGTFGWMLTDAQGQKLVTGAGPVDGPAAQASSTRSELHGFAAPLKYIHQLACFYSMRAKGLYEWECDSECAITRADSLLQFKQRRRQPYNADIISTLAQRLRQNRSMSFKSTWVKAHQDDDKLPGQVLSDAALQNIRVDSIATDSTSRVDSLRPAPMLRMWYQYIHPRNQDHRQV